MGYYGNGFVFTREPAWDNLAGFPPAVGLTGYQHKRRDIWLLDAWTCRPRAGKHWPFTDVLGETAIKAPDQPTIKTFERICTVVRKDDDETYGAGYLRIAAHVSKLLGIDTYFFAADDEDMDMAAVASDGKLEAFRVQFGVWLVEFDGRAFVATPSLPDEDDDEDEDEDDDVASGPSEAVTKALAKIPGVSVKKPSKAVRKFYSSAVALWPAAAGSSSRTLGIGTWDPFMNMERDFREVFARPCK